MNFDMNTLSTLFNAFSTINEPKATHSGNQANEHDAQRVQNASCNDAKSCKSRFENCDGYRFDVSPFVSQNGLGEDVSIFSNDEPTLKNAQVDSAQANKFESVLNAFAKIQGAQQNNMLPLVEMVKSMTAGKKGDLSSMLPMLMSVMQAKSNQKPQSSNQNNENMQDEQTQDNSNADSTNKKTQLLGRYTPIAFAGYPAICALAKLENACSLDKLVKH